MPIVTEILVVLVTFYCLLHPTPKMHDMVKLDYEVLEIEIQDDCYIFYARNLADDTIEKYEIYRRATNTFPDDIGVYFLDCYKWKGKYYNKHNQELSLSKECSLNIGLGVKLNK